MSLVDPIQWRRCSALFVLLLHALMVAAGPLADARLETEFRRVPVGLHVEDANQTPCAPTHHHEYCLTCRALQSYDAPSSASLVLASGARRTGSIAAALSLRELQPFSALGPRGPPNA